MKKKEVAICLNIILVILEIIGIIITIRNTGYIDLKYYTELSNILSLIASVILLYFLFKGSVPKGVGILKFMSVVSLTVTFLVVLFILIPMYDFNYKWLLFSGDMIFYHLFCPIIAFISFVFFENYKFDKKDCLKANTLTFIYAIIMVILNVCNVVDGPYPFLRIRSQNVLMSFFWMLVTIGGSYLISLGLKTLKEKVK